MEYIEWARAFYPLPAFLPDDVVIRIIEFVFDPLTDPW